jgi:hypothetical protein
MQRRGAPEVAVVQPSRRKLVERVSGGAGGRTWREFLDSGDNPLRGAYGGDPQAYVDELRGPWRADRS